MAFGSFTAYACLSCHHINTFVPDSCSLITTFEQVWGNCLCDTITTLKYSRVEIIGRVLSCMCLVVAEEAYDDAYD